MANGLNLVDYALIGIFLFSALSGMMRGGVKEIVSLISWVVAFFVAGLFARPLASLFGNSQPVQALVNTASSTLGVSASSQASMITIGICFTLIFIGTLIVGSIIGYILNSAVEAGGLSIFNRLLGGITGIGRGYLINLVIIFLVQLTPVSEQNFWQESSLVKGYEPAVAWLSNFVQPGLDSLKTKVGDTLNDFSTGVQNAGGAMF